MSSPRISIGIPVYDGERFIENALDCLLAQTYGDFEIIICDNASNDSTVDICKRYVKLDSRIRLHQYKENIGAPKNYNRVFELARGEFFKWAAADDLLDPRYLETCIDALDANEDAVLAYPETQIIDEFGEALRYEPTPMSPIMEDPVSRFRNVLSSMRECNAVFGLIRRDVLAKTQLIRPYFFSDGHLLAELALYGKLVAVPGEYFFRREHEQASSYDKSREVQVEFWEPERREQPLNPMSRAFRADLTSIRRAPLTLQQSLSATGFTLRRIWWKRNHIFHEARESLAYAFRSVRGRSAGGVGVQY